VGIVKPAYGDEDREGGNGEIQLYDSHEGKKHTI
jgi:hypothetical protein